MPVIDFIQPDGFTQIVTWELTEKVEELLDYVHLTPKREEKFKSLKPKQAKEFLGLRACLLELNSDLDVLYDDRGKPYLPSDNHLSITHSYGKVSVGISQFHIGIDIEKRRNEKILNVERKFIRPDEKIWIPRNESLSEYLHIIWGIKEGLYKINGGNLWNFLHHYRVESFNLVENQTINCWISDEVSSRKYFAYYKKIKGYYLIWVLDYE